MVNSFYISYEQRARIMKKKAGKEAVIIMQREENRELAKDYGLKQVPALVIKDESGNSTYVGVPEIKKYHFSAK